MPWIYSSVPVTYHNPLFPLASQTTNILLLPLLWYNTYLIIIVIVDTWKHWTENSEMKNQTQKHWVRRFIPVSTGASLTLRAYLSPGHRFLWSSPEQRYWWFNEPKGVVRLPACTLLFLSDLDVIDIVVLIANSLCAYARVRKQRTATTSYSV